jgi:outer membrane protein assembly factor BamD
MIVSCSHSKVEVWDEDIQANFDKGIEFLNKKKYYRAQEEFNTILLRGRHTDLADDAQFYLGESYFLNKEYLLAISEYERLVRQMIYSPFVEKARYRICESYTELSPKYYHDQEYTVRAIDKLQEFIEDYPNSEYVDDATQSIKKLRNKLARKVYESGILYIKMEEYNSAINYFEDLLETYYDTKWADPSRLKIVEVHIKAGDVEKAKDYLNQNGAKFKDQDLLNKAEDLVSKALGKENRGR